MSSEPWTPTAVFKASHDRGDVECWQSLVFFWANPLRKIGVNVPSAHLRDPKNKAMDSPCNYVGSIINAMITMLPDKTNNLGSWHDPPAL